MSCRAVDMISVKECGKGCGASVLERGVATEVEMGRQDEKRGSDEGFAKQI